MTYHFKGAEELVWFLAVAVLPVLFEAALTFQPEKIVDWRVWLTSILAACVRAVGGAGLAWLARRKMEAPPKAGA